MVEKVDQIVLCKDKVELQQGQAGLEIQGRGVESCAQLGLEPAAKKLSARITVYYFTYNVRVCSDVCIFRLYPSWGFRLKSCWVLPAPILLKLNSPWFICRYFLCPGMPHIWLCPLLFALSLLPASISIKLRFHHVLSFHVDGGCSWIYGFLHRWGGVGGLTFQRETKNDFTACCVEYEFVDGQGESSKH